MWSKMQTNFEWWEVELVFRVTGRGRIGADGLVSVNLCNFIYLDSQGCRKSVFLTNCNYFSGVLVQ